MLSQSQTFATWIKEKWKKIVPTKWMALWIPGCKNAVKRLGKCRDSFNFIWRWQIVPTKLLETESTVMIQQDKVFPIPIPSFLRFNSMEIMRDKVALLAYSDCSNLPRPCELSQLRTTVGAPKDPEKLRRQWHGYNLPGSSFFAEDANMIICVRSIQILHLHISKRPQCRLTRPSIPLIVPSFH